MFIGDLPELAVLAKRALSNLHEGEYCLIPLRGNLCRMFLSSQVKVYEVNRVHK